MGLTRPRAYQIFDLDYKQSVRVVTVSNVTLSGGAPNQVDGVNLSLKDRVLVTGQSTASQNGLYFVTTLGTGSNGTWQRSIDGNETGEIDAGMIIMVTEGNTYADTQWKLTTNDPIVIGSTALTFVQNYSANSISSGTSNVVVNSSANVTVSASGTANVLTVTSTGTVTSGTASATGNITSGNVLTGGLISATGNITGGNVLGGANVNATTHTGTTVSVTANITGGNLLTGGLISSTGNITGGNLRTTGVVSATGTVSGLELTSTQSSGSEGGQINLAQPASGSTLAGGITIDAFNNTLRFFEQGGTARGAFIDLTACSAGVGTNLLSGGGGGTPGGSNTFVQFNDAGTFGGNAQFTYDKVTNSLTVGNVYTTSNGAGTNLRVGDDAWIGDINETNTLRITGQQNAANGYIVFGNSDSTGKLGRAGTGPLTYAGAFSATGNVTGGNILTGGIISATGNVSGGNVAAATAIFSLGTVGASGNTSGGNLTTGGQVSATGTITGGNLATGGTISATGNITGGNVIVAGNIVDTGALSIITSSNGNITLAPNGTGVIVVNTDIRNGQANGVGNIGASGAAFNTIFARATSAQYADLAEMYVSDADYDPGTVVEFGGEYEITITTTSHSTAVAGIISTNPSYLMNSTQAGEHVLPVALTGRVPCRVQGPVKKGDVLVASSTPGVAQRIGIDWQPGCVVGKAMEIIADNSIQTIEVAVGRL